MEAGKCRGCAPCLDEPRSLLPLQDVLDPSKHWLKHGELHLRCNLLVQIQDATYYPCFLAPSNSSRLQVDYGQLLHGGCFGADTAIVVDSAGVEQTIKANACVLWARCDFFRRALEWKQRQGQQFSITLGAGLTAHAVETAVCFIYTGAVQPEALVELEDVWQLVRASSFLDLKELTAICEETIVGKLSKDTVAEALTQAEHFDLPVLRAACASLLSSHIHKFERPALQSLARTHANELPLSPGEQQGQRLHPRVCQPPGHQAQNFRRNKYVAKEIPAESAASQNLQLLDTHALDFVVRDQVQVAAEGAILHCMRFVCEPIVLPNSWQPGQQVFFVGDPSLGPQYRAQGKVIGKGHTQDALSILFEGHDGISSITHTALASEDPGLPGGLLVDQEVHFVGEPREFNGGDVLPYRKMGIILGNAAYVRVKTHVKVMFDGFEDRNARLEVDATLLRATDPGLPGNFELDQVVYYQNPRRAEPLKRPLLGVTVRRGRDWKWGDQDGGKGSRGTTLGSDSSGWVGVRWPSGERNRYRVGAEGAYDLEICSSQAKVGSLDYTWFAKDSFFKGQEGKVVGPADWEKSKTHIKDAIDVGCDEVGKEPPSLHGSFQTNDRVYFFGSPCKKNSFEMAVPAASIRGKRRGEVLKSSVFKLSGLMQDFRFDFYPKGWTKAAAGKCSFYMWSSEHFRQQPFLLSVNNSTQLITDSISANSNRGLTNFCAIPDGDVKLKVELSPTLTPAQSGRVLGASGIDGFLSVLFDGCHHPIQIPSSLLMKEPAECTPSISSRFFGTFGSTVLSAFGHQAEEQARKRVRQVRLQRKESRRVSAPNCFPRRGYDRKR
eukprot:TRINITY_DN42638_c0_g1_i1.p1 TRINITY_DN42638_c0_g1~~TRINITY_DN42638_c0_g1_i1.p1  ORF type:complete len:959 (-),score=159.02 TRINITY_DN42638_c0_g1_i1:62-2569(-)